MNTENQNTDNAQITSTDEWDEMTEESFEKLRDEARELDQPEILKQVEELADKWRKQQEQLAILERQASTVFYRRPPQLDMDAYQLRLWSGHVIGKPEAGRRA
ncbi:hypothetical protein [Phyllobacterium sp. P5_D12]